MCRCCAHEVLSAKCIMNAPARVDGVVECVGCSVTSQRSILPHCNMKPGLWCPFVLVASLYVQAWYPSPAQLLCSQHRQTSFLLRASSSDHLTTGSKVASFVHHVPTLNWLMLMQSKMSRALIARSSAGIEAAQTTQLGHMRRQFCSPPQL
jgi:hypothetical protein